MPWKKEELEVIEQMKRTCVVNMYMQSSSAHVCSLIHNLLTIPNIIVGGVMSVSLFSSHDEKSRIAAGVLAVLSTVLSSLTKQLSAGERAQQHCSLVKEYHAVIRNIEVTLAVEDDEFELEAFIRSIQEEINRLYILQPEPSWLATKRFERKFRCAEHSIMFPEIVKYATQVVGMQLHVPPSPIPRTGRASVDSGSAARRSNPALQSILINRFAGLQQSVTRPFTSRQMPTSSPSSVPPTSDPNSEPSSQANNISLHISTLASVPSSSADRLDV